MLPAAFPMFFRDRAQQKTLWRLLLAAVQVACVLVWASAAKAEDLSPDGGRSASAGSSPAGGVAADGVVAGSTPSSAVGTNAPSGNSGAPGNSRAVGMCGTSAQSIAAPPPIYPSTDAAAKPCAPPSEEFRVGVPLLPTDGPATVDLTPEKSAVLPSTVLYPQRLTLATPPSRLLDCPGEEHRARALRPPQT
jgi:hypothetical protein